MNRVPWHGTLQLGPSANNSVIAKIDLGIIHLGSSHTCNDVSRAQCSETGCDLREGDIKRGHFITSMETTTRTEPEWDHTEHWEAHCINLSSKPQFFSRSHHLSRCGKPGPHSGESGPKRIIENIVGKFQSLLKIHGSRRKHYDKGTQGSR